MTFGNVFQNKSIFTLTFTQTPTGEAFVFKRMYTLRPQCSFVAHGKLNEDCIFFVLTCTCVVYLTEIAQNINKHLRVARAYVVPFVSTTLHCLNEKNLQTFFFVVI